MKKTLNKDKLLTIGILPAMWLIYFLFEVVTGRVTDLYTLLVNLSLVFLFALVGFIIYLISSKFPNGFKSKTLFSTFIVIMLIDQGIKFIIGRNFFNEYFEIIPNFLSFDPIINTHGSWLNARFDFDISFPVLIIINFIALFIFFELYRYIKFKSGKTTFWGDMCFVFIMAGALCSLIDKVFYGGSLDFIGISNLFIADIKDIYINLGLLFFIMATYKSDFLKEEENSTLKDDIQSIKRFLRFIKNDLKRNIKKEKA